MAVDNSFGSLLNDKAEKLFTSYTLVPRHVRVPDKEEKVPRLVFAYLICCAAYGFRSYSSTVVS